MANYYPALAFESGLREGRTQVGRLEVHGREERVLFFVLLAQLNATQVVRAAPDCVRTNLLIERDSAKLNSFDVGDYEIYARVLE